MALDTLRPAARETGVLDGFRGPSLFVGREEELARVDALLHDSRLVVVYGVAGTGKTSMVLHARGQLAAALGARSLYHRCRPGERVGTLATIVRRALDPHAPDVHDEQVDSLVAEGPLLLVLDDAHVVADGSLWRALATAITRSTPLWLLVASRALLPLDPTEVDHQVVRLGALTDEQASALWSELSRRYGPPRTTLEQVLLSGPRTPWAIKSAFGRGEVVPDGFLPPSLSDGARALLTLLCALRVPVSDADARALLPPPEDAARALAELERVFLVERSGPSHVTLHDLVREAVMRSPLRPGPAAHAACMAHHLARAGDPDAVPMEALHHAVAAGALDVAVAQIELGLSRAPLGFYPLGSVLEPELLAAIEELGRHRELPGAVARLGVRLRTRRGDPLREVQPALEALRARGEPIEAELGVAQFYAGNLEQAIELLAAAIDRTDDLILRAFLALPFAGACRTMARLDLLHGLPARLRLPGQAHGPLHMAVTRVVEAVICLDAEPDRALDLLAQTVRDASGAGLHLLRLPLLDSFLRYVRRLNGREARVGALAEVLDTNVFTRCIAMLVEADEAHTCGEPRRSAELAGCGLSAARAHEYGDLAAWAAHRLADGLRAQGKLHEAALTLSDGLAPFGAPLAPRTRLRTAIARSRLLLDAGRVDEAYELARQTLSEACERFPAIALEARALATRAAALLPEDVPPLPEVRVGAPGAEWHDLRLAEAEHAMLRGDHGEARVAIDAADTAARAAGWLEKQCRAALLRAELALREALPSSALAQIEIAEQLATRQGYAEPALRASALRASASLLHGEREDAARRLREAARRAEATGLTLYAMLPSASSAPSGDRRLELATRWAQRLELFALRPMRLDGGGPTLHLTEAQAARLRSLGDRTLVDLDLGLVVRAGSAARADVSSRPVLRRLLALLAASERRAVPAEEIARRVMDLDYHPITHRSRVSMAIRRLRDALGEDAIRTNGDAYVLDLPAPCHVLSREQDRALS